MRLSSHRLWLPVRTPVHNFSVSPYETPTLPGLRDYLPAMLMLGALAAAFIYFGAAAISDRRDRGALLLASIAASAAAQLIVEVSRAFIAYTYPWHLARVTTIALLAALGSVLAAAYAARRFSPSWGRTVVVTTAAAALAMLVLVPWYDLKAMGAILAGAVALAACAFPRLREGRRDARVALGAAAAILLAMVWQRTRFLDQGYYFIVAGLLVALVVEQVNRVRQIRAERDLETRRAEALAERLARAERDGERIIALKDGSRAYRVAEGDIVYARAADDYCDVVLRDGRSLLVTMSLARLVGALPRFVRVHKSYAVNRQYVTTISSRSGGGRELELSDGTAIPVGRSYTSSLASWT